MTTASPLTIIAITKAAAGRQAELRAAQEKLVAETLREPGCLRYELSQSLDDGRVLIFTESWESEEAWRAHMEGAAMWRFQDAGAVKLIEEFTLHRMATVAGSDHSIAA